MKKIYKLLLDIDIFLNNNNLDLYINYELLKLLLKTYKRKKYNLVISMFL